MKTKYTRELADAVCDRMACGENLIDICNDIGIKRYDVSNWARYDIDDFYNRYTRARQQQIEYMLDDVVRVTQERKRDAFKNPDGKRYINHAAVQRDRLIADTLKWVACKVVPKMPSFKGTLMEMGNGVINGVEKEGLPPEQAAQMMKLLESVANIKRVDEFEEVAKLIPGMQAKITEFERLRDERAEGKTSE